MSLSPPAKLEVIASGCQLELCSSCWPTRFATASENAITVVVWELRMMARYVAACSAAVEMSLL